MRYVVSLSGGTASAVAADRAINRYGRDRVTLWFADTSWEDPDLHRFIADCMARWGGRLITHKDGRTPLDVASQRKIIPSQKMAPCAEELKVRPFREWLYRQPKPITVLLGLDWSEVHRIDQRQKVHRSTDGRPRLPVGYQARISGVSEDYPLMWRPYETRGYHDAVREWGIAPPRLYADGFPHNNCGGRCVKQGRRERIRLYHAHPERFAEVRAWEDAARAGGGARANRAILRSRRGGETLPLPLSDLEAELQRRPDLFAAADPVEADNFACFCTF